MNIAGLLESEFEQFRNTAIIQSMKSLKPSDKVAILDTVMRRGGLGGRPIRHIPIIEPVDPKDPKRGCLKALISKVDVATLLSPPWDLIPKDVVDQGLIDIRSLSEDTKRVCRQTIQEAFQGNFSGKPPEVHYKASLGTALRLLTDSYNFDSGGSVKTRRYKTIPVFNDQSSLIGMLSYMDILREIKARDEGHEPFLNKTVKQLLDQIGQEISKIETIEPTDSIFDAISLFERVSFTHLPVKSGNFTVAIVDDVLVRTYEHPAFFEAFSHVQLENIASPVDQNKNVVSMNDPLRSVIGKFLQDDRPTAVLVGELKHGKLQMEGVISYLDILRNFQATFLNVNSVQGSSQE